MKQLLSIKCIILLTLTTLLGTYSLEAQNAFRLLDQNFGTTIRCINDQGEAVSGGRYYSYLNDSWTPKEAEAAELNSLNNNGEVSGVMPFDTLLGTYQPAYRDANGVWHPIGYFSNIANPNDYFSMYKISHNGKFVTGQMSQDNFISSVFKYETQAGTLKKISTPTHQSIAAYSVNNLGYTVGWYDTEFNGGGTFREACYTGSDDAIHFIPTVSGTHTQGTANDINDSNVVVGEMDTTAFIYDINNNTLLNFGPIGGYQNMTFTAVSNTGVAVGYVQKFGDFGDLIRDAIIYHPQISTQPMLLKTLLVEYGNTVNTPDSLIGTAYSISANGRFVAGWNGPYVFGYGFIVDLNQIISDVKSPITTNLVVSPNPAQEYIYLQNTPEMKNGEAAQLHLVDALGKVVLSKNVTNSLDPIFIGELPSGIYFLSLKNKNITYTTRLVIE